MVVTNNGSMLESGNLKVSSMDVETVFCQPLPLPLTKKQKNDG